MIATALMGLLIVLSIMVFFCELIRRNFPWPNRHPKATHILGFALTMFFLLASGLTLTGGQQKAYEEAFLEELRELSSGLAGSVGEAWAEVERQDKEKAKRKAAYERAEKNIAELSCGEKRDALRQVVDIQKTAKGAYKAARREYLTARNKALWNDVTDKAAWGRITEMKSVQSEAARQHDFIEKIADAVSASLDAKGCSTT